MDLHIQKKYLFFNSILLCLCQITVEPCYKEAKGLAKYFCYNMKISFYQGSFSYILILLGQLRDNINHHSKKSTVLAAHSGLWHLTFAPWRLENLTFLIEIIHVCWARWVSQVQSTVLPSIFLEHSLDTCSRFFYTVVCYIKLPQYWVLIIDIIKGLLILKIALSSLLRQLRFSCWASSISCQLA